MTKTQNNIIFPQIIPIEGTTFACLIGFSHKANNHGIFSEIGSYIGYDYHFTPTNLKLDRVPFNGKIYTITEIKRCSFSHCSEIQTIEIGQNVNSIEWNMYGCNSLQNITVDTHNSIYHDIDGVLFKGSELIAFPQGRTGNYIVPEGTTKIGNHAFKASQLSSIVFPQSLIEIGINAFYECKSIKEFILPQSIKIIHMNCNRQHQPITQRFYLSSDSFRSNPLSIKDVVNMFKA